MMSIFRVFVANHTPIYDGDGSMFLKFKTGRTFIFIISPLPKGVFHTCYPYTIERSHILVEDGCRLDVANR